MAYSWTWDNNFPNGATYPAADIDTAIQQLELAINERLNTLMGFAINAPFVDPLINTTTTKSLTALTTLATAAAASITILNNLINVPCTVLTDTLLSNTDFNFAPAIITAAGGWFEVSIYAQSTTGTPVGIQSIALTDLNTPSADGCTFVQEYKSDNLTGPDLYPIACTVTCMIKVSANVSPGLRLNIDANTGSIPTVIVMRKLGPL